MKKILFAVIVLLVVIASCSKKSVPTKAVAIDAASLFSTNCARCHGPEGIKDSRTPNLQTIDLDKAGLINGITHGKNHMPAWEGKLTTEEISALADLIVGWHKK